LTFHCQLDRYSHEVKSVHTLASNSLTIDDDDQATAADVDMNFESYDKSSTDVTSSIQVSTNNATSNDRIDQHLNRIAMTWSRDMCNANKATRVHDRFAFD
jgi:hypothetical protein